MTTNGSALKSPSVNGGNVQRNKLHVKTAMHYMVSLRQGWVHF